MEDKKTFYQNNSIDTILNKCNYVDFIFYCKEIVKNITKELHDFSSKEEDNGKRK